MSDDLDISTTDEAQEVAWLYSEMLRRAIECVEGNPRCYHVSEREWAKLVIDGQTATLYWPHLTTDWDHTIIESREISFPTDLLFMSDAKREEWEKEQRAKYDEEQKDLAKRHQEKATREAERAERAAYNRLKAKYG